MDVMRSLMFRHGETLHAILQNTTRKDGEKMAVQVAEDGLAHLLFNQLPLDSVADLNVFEDGLKDDIVRNQVV